MNRIALQTRLDRIEKGYAGDPDYVSHAIRSMAAVPLTRYLRDFPGKAAELADLLGMSRKAGEKLTYGQAAWYIRTLNAVQGRQEAIAQAVGILAMPLMKCYEERRWAYGESTQDTA